MILKKDIDKIFIELTQPDPFLARLDNFLEEKLEWLQQVVDDAKKNGFKLPTLPKTPAAAKRTRKRCRLSTVQEDDAVEVASPALGQKRVTRNTSKMAKHKLWTLEASPNHKPRKKLRSSKDVSVKLFDESVMVCSPAAPVVVKKELVVIDEAVCQEENRQPETPRSQSNFDLVPSLSMDSGFDARMEEECLSSTLLKPSEGVLNINSELVMKTTVNSCTSVTESQVGDKMVYETIPPTPCKQELDTSNKLQSDASFIDLRTPCNRKLNCTSDVLEQPVQDANINSAWKHNLTYDLKGGESSELDVATPPLPTLNSTFVVAAPEGIKKEKSLNCNVERKSGENPTASQPISHEKTSLTEQCNNSSRQGSNGAEGESVETIADMARTVLEVNSPDRKTREPERAVPAETKIPEPVTPSPRTRSTRNARSNRTVSGCEQKTPSSTQRPIARARSATPKGKKIPVFSPYASESVKKRVAAYEKLRSVPEAADPDSASGARMTRTKTRAAAAAAAALVACEKGEEKPQKQKKPKNDAEKLKVLAKHATKDVDTRKERCEPGKENSILMSASRIVAQSAQKPNARTPYTPQVLGDIHNFSSLSAKSVSSKPGVITTSVNTFINKLPVKPTQEERDGKKVEEQKKRKEKEMEAIMKREELLREKAEAQKRKREERMKKVLQARQAHEKEKEEQQRLLLEEKNQRMKCIIREQEAKQKEQMSKKKLHTQQKIAEVEERRKLEEAARLAKLKEQEEEQQRIQAIRKKEHEEAERLRQKRLAEEKEAALFREKVEQLAKAEAKAKEIPSNVKELGESKLKAPKAASTILCKEGFMGFMSKNVNDYGLDDVKSGESSDDEEKPKKVVPPWAHKSHRLHPLKFQAGVPEKLLAAFMSCSRHSPDLSEIFPNLLRMKRTSSAVWSTPPLRTNKDAFF